MAVNTNSGKPIRLVATYTSSGTFTPPTGTTAVFASIHGAGGGGGAGGYDSNSRYGGGNVGGSGGSNIIAGTWVQVVPGVAASVTIGAGGAGVMNEAGAAGGTTSFDGAFSVTGANGGSVGQSGSPTYGPGTAGNAGGSSASSTLSALPPSNIALPRAGFTVSTLNSGGGNGGGGGGGRSTAGSPNSTGGTGQSGIIYIYA
jgi:hypothetical protein